MSIEGFLSCFNKRTMKKSLDNNNNSVNTSIHNTKPYSKFKYIGDSKLHFENMLEYSDSNHDSYFKNVNVEYVISPTHYNDLTKPSYTSSYPYYKKLKKPLYEDLNSYYKNFRREMSKFYSHKSPLPKEIPQTDVKSFLRDNHDDKMHHLFEIYSNFKIETISDITANKCIVDSLGKPISDINNIKIDVCEINDWMLKELNKNPIDLYKLSSRKFEELIAEIFIRKGYNVELTPTTHDGGKDIYVANKNDFGSFLYLVECKKYNPTRKVGVSVIRDLYGVLSKERATYAIAVTTSYFTKPAQEFQQELQYQMSLQDFSSIKKWLCDVT